MALIAYPGVAVGDFSIGQVTFDMAETSDSTGSTAARMFGPPRWTASIASPAANVMTDASKWEALLLRLRGKVNTLYMHDIYCVAPRGTMRGTVFLGAAIAQGATTMTIANAVGTLNAGDWLGINTGLGSSQLVKVVADAVSSIPTAAGAVWHTTTPATATWQTSGAQPATWQIGGTMTVTFEPPMRMAYPFATSVIWDKPVAYYKAVNQQNSGKYIPGLQAKAAYAVDLLEVFA